MNHGTMVEKTANYENYIEFLVKNEYICSEKRCSNCENIKMNLNKNKESISWSCDSRFSTKSVLPNIILENSKIRLKNLFYLIYF